MRAKFIPLLLAIFCLGLTAQATAGSDGCAVVFNTVTRVAYVGGEFPSGFPSWGSESEGNWHPRANPLLIQYDQIQRMEVCILDGGGCAPMWFTTMLSGTLIWGGQIGVPYSRDLLVKAVTWDDGRPEPDRTYWAPVDKPGKPMSYFWHLTGCYLVQRPDGTWGVRTDP